MYIDIRYSFTLKNLRLQLFSSTLLTIKMNGRSNRKHPFSWILAEGVSCLHVRGARSALACPGPVPLDATPSPAGAGVSLCQVGLAVRVNYTLPFPCSLTVPKPKPLCRLCAKLPGCIIPSPRAPRTPRGLQRFLQSPPKASRQEPLASSLGDS